MKTSETVFSRDSLKAFIVLMFSYLVMLVVMVALHDHQLLDIEARVNSVETFIFSIPMIALYLMLVLAASAGFASANNMLGQLPFKQLFKAELENRKLSEAHIQAGIRSGVQLKMDDKYLFALKNILSSRIPIVAVIDGQGNASNVLTASDLLEELQFLLDQKDDSEKLKLLNALSEKTIEEMKPVAAIGVKRDDHLGTALDLMVSRQITKLVVTDNNKFAGTIDALDVLAAVISQNGHE